MGGNADENKIADGRFLSQWHCPHLKAFALRRQFYEKSFLLKMETSKISKICKSHDFQKFIDQERIGGVLERKKVMLKAY